MTHHDQVNAKLHNLRGETFRRQLNLTGIKNRRRPAVLSGGPSLPPSLYTNEVSLVPEINRLSPINSHRQKIPGPPPPRSWVTSTSAVPNPIDPFWRSSALSFIFNRSSCYSKSQLPPQAQFPHSSSSTSSTNGIGVATGASIPSLFHICLRAILVKFDGIPSYMYRDIPRHILREYVRCSVIHRPLPKEDLLEIWSLDNMNAVDGELLVTGSMTTSALSRSTIPSGTIVEDWDAEPNNSECGDQYEGNLDTPSPVHTFIALTASFNSSHITLLTPSITHLALLNIPKTPLRLLSTQLPLLVVLDLSYNSWINDAHALRLDWQKWADLEAVALRGCRITASDVEIIRQEITKGRLLDLEIITGS